MRQVLYVSHAVRPLDGNELGAIVHSSRNNNALDGVTGLLWSDGRRFAQVIEGDERAVAEAMERIAADSRHREIDVLHDRPVSEREFGSWSMDLRSATDTGDAFDARLRRMLDDASAATGDFDGLIPV